MADDLPYLLRRAEQESILAVAALHPAAAAAHRELSQVYTRAALTRMRAPAEVQPL